MAMIGLLGHPCPGAVTDRLATDQKYQSVNRLFTDVGHIGGRAMSVHRERAPCLLTAIPPAYLAARI